MLDWFVQQIAKAVSKRLRVDLKNAVSDINTHTTSEMEKHMATLDESIDRLTSAVSTELAQVRAEAQAHLEATQAALDEASADNTELTAALEAQVERATSLTDAIDSAQGRIDGISSGFEANDPQAPVEEVPVEPAPVEPAPEEPAVEEPVDPNAPHVDNTLPGDLPPENQP